ncbi:hypothetical protein [Chondrinema litorale]|uniref:hypothetical protein n=1 Tax=Chondrinema litorale TaxID=2994555 RepID=UPI0025432C43|nr:hypothetical protein [Chondrinema litorale]UZR93607.1 hypothetical protein OQ292_17290 [Chondrinema litorale]
MESFKLSELQKKYQSERAHTLTEEQFGSLVLFYPSLLIIASDGKIDEEEWLYVDYLAKFIADTFKNEISAEARDVLQEKYLAELKYLAENLEKWESAFIEVLKDYISVHEEVKEDVEDILHLFAEASDGKSDEEEIKIEELKGVLQI